MDGWRTSGTLIINHYSIVTVRNLLTSVITPMRSMSRAGLLGSSLGVECPLGGEEEAKEEAVAEAVMEAPWWCIRARLRPSRLTLATRFSISSARSSVDSFSSWISL